MRQRPDDFSSCYVLILLRAFVAVLLQVKHLRVRHAFQSLAEDSVHEQETCNRE